MTGWDDVKGFKVVPKGWIVERTFDWLDRYRRWSKDSKYLVSPSENMIYIAMIQLHWLEVQQIVARISVSLLLAKVCSTAMGASVIAIGTNVSIQDNRDRAQNFNRY